MFEVKRFCLTGAASLALAGCLSAAVLTVDAKSEIFSAGAATPYDSMALLPPTIAASAGQLLTFSSVTGTASCGTACGTAGPDGADLGFVNGTNLSITNSGISGITFIGRQMFLVGVFLGAGVPSGANPAGNTYTNASVLGSSFSPGLAQVFFIGDGQGTGGTQTFIAPAGTTRLFLGFADGVPGFNGQSGAYGDNSGALTATFALAASPVPEPGTLGLFGLGFAALALAARKRAV